MKKFCPFIPLFSLLLEEAGISSVTDELFPLRTMQSPFAQFHFFLEIQMLLSHVIFMRVGQAYACSP